MAPFTSRARSLLTGLQLSSVRAFEEKAASLAIQSVTVGTGPGRVQWSTYPRKAYAAEGFEQNAVVYACVRLLRLGVRQIPIRLYRKDASGERVEIKKHAALDLLARPNERDSGHKFAELWAMNVCVYGNAFVHGPPRISGSGKGEPLELWHLPPPFVAVAEGQTTAPVKGYLYRETGTDVPLPAAEVMHSRFPHPTSFWEGLSPLSAGGREVDADNAASAWNVARLQNDAVPTGWINVRGSISKTAAQRIRAKFDGSFAGLKASGGNPRKPIITEGKDGIDYKQFGLNALEMDWTGGRQAAALGICRVYGVPGQMIGIPGSQTYANYEQAEKSLYRSGILPMVDELCDDLTRWLAPKYADLKDAFFGYDVTAIDALAEDRGALFTAARAGFDGGFLTQREAVVVAGQDPADSQGVYKVGLGVTFMTPAAVERIGLEAETPPEPLDLTPGGSDPPDPDADTDDPDEDDPTKKGGPGA